MSDTTTITLTFVVYVIVLLILGIVAYRKTQSLSDYILGGRTLGRWVSALSAGSSDMSAWLLLGLPGYAYLSGLEAGWIALGLFTGTILNWIYIAPKLRASSEKAQDALTIPEFFEHHFQDKTHTLRIISALFILLFYFFYTSAGLVAAGKLFESVFNIDYQFAVMIGTALIMLYTAFGGFLAVSWTDLFQGLLMFFALTMTVLVAQYETGGWEPAITILEKDHSALLDIFTNNLNTELSLLSIISLLSWGLGYFGQPHILVRFMAIRSQSIIPQARIIAITWTGLCLTFAILIGLFGVVLLETPLVGNKSETVLIELLPLLFHPLLAGIVLAAILAAIMSTADSQLLVAASVATEDIFHVIINKHAKDQTLIWLGRIIVIIMAIFAALLALTPDNKILDLVAYAWAGFGAAFGPVLILGLHSKSVNYYGALAGIITGGITVVLWDKYNNIIDLYGLLPGFLASTIAILIVSKLSNNSTNQAK